MDYQFNDALKSSLFTNIPDMQDICQPLKQIGITFFCYSEFTSDNTLTTLVSSYNIPRYYFTNEGYKVDPFMNNPVISIPGLYLVESHANNNSQREFLQMLKSNGAAESFSIVKFIQNGMRHYHFGMAHRNPAEINYCISNYDLFEAFILYFHEKAERLLNCSDKIIIPKFTLDLPSDTLGDTIAQDDLKRRRFLDAIEYDTVKFDAVPTKKPFTSRERQCLSLVIKGKSAKNIAKNLDLSVRTIEFYMNNIKKKTDSRTIAELISILREHIRY